jgi:hypothetical protein
MKANTLAIQSYRKIPATRNELHAISSGLSENTSAAVINIADKTEQVTASEVKAGSKGWVMPPIVYAYMKGRDNDPL